MIKCIPEVTEVIAMYFFFPKQSSLDNEDKDERNLFDPKGILFFPMLFTCLGVTAVLVVFGVAWDLCRRFRCRNTRKGLLNFVVVAIDLLVTQCSFRSL